MMRGAAALAVPAVLGLAASTAPSPQDVRCSLNGRWVHSSGSSDHCACSAAWTGQKCELLALLPTPAGADYDVRQATGLSTWGASIVQLNDSWHMYVSEFMDGCGECELHTCLPRSLLPPLFSDWHPCLVERRCHLLADQLSDRPRGRAVATRAVEAPGGGAPPVEPLRNRGRGARRRDDDPAAALVLAGEILQRHWQLQRRAPQHHPRHDAQRWAEVRRRRLPLWFPPPRGGVDSLPRNQQQRDRQQYTNVVLKSIIFSIKSIICGSTFNLILSILTQSWRITSMRAEFGQARVRFVR